MLQNRSYRIIIAGGGTGGHIFPAIAIANELKRQLPDVEILFVGANGRMEMRLVKDAGYDIKGITISGLQRKISFKNLLSNLRLPFVYWKSLQDAKNILLNFQPDAVVGVGGYVSAPVLKSAIKIQIPTLIQEQNSYPGITNKMLSKDVGRICVAYSGLERFFPAQKIVITGNPVRNFIVEKSVQKSEALQYFGLQEGKKTIAITGGSLGAKTINEAIENCVNELINNDLQLIWQTGNAFYQSLPQNIRQLPNIYVSEFIKEMDYLYAAADVIVSRAGALSVSELCIAGKPCVLVPSPNVAEDHQTKNARFLSDCGAAILLPDEKTATELKNILLTLLANENKLKNMEQNLLKLALPNAAEKIVNEIIKLIQENDK
ncbi:MAG: undecaprenyldiphospho-muramoylpentapeptide beta-N-acetylglucosaminyltransferase [Bacteroidales bacterium]|jgi:UDP-N-acetylglucosamine--N-acetylmuramyl-(pentapeptide) pyrophosphoryl-undecaprenol N-acetylglucosamine transferase|nr:undecaprenyldiphospho-muramoylpentapeptide beta-N-acetylglucosaminyltransferase [Bacteroidales bacterium]